MTIRSVRHVSESSFNPRWVKVFISVALPTPDVVSVVKTLSHGSVSRGVGRGSLTHKRDPPPIVGIVIGDEKGALVGAESVARLDTIGEIAHKDRGSPR